MQRGPLKTRRRRFRPGVERVEPRLVLSTYTVNSLGDDGAGSGLAGDLRYVITLANTLRTGTAAEPDLIRFDGVAITPGRRTIAVGSGAAGARPLPRLTEPAIIDGTSARGFDNLNGVLLRLDGGGLRSGDGLVLAGGSSTVQGLAIGNFPGHGILVTSADNTVGGVAVGVDAQGRPNNPAGRITSPLPPSPTEQVLVRPPLGNIIGGNGGDGIRIEGKAAQNNLIAGNFIGTDVSGLVAQGNRGNGVSIIGANNNRMLGTTPPDANNPFVYYNVVSGNRGNGLLIRDAKATTVYACFFGLAADNRTPLGNGLNGVLIAGRSDQTNFGGNIPLGNVTSANGRNGVEIRDHASRTLVGNAFGGVAAFNPAAQVGNAGSGILVTSDGGTKRFGSGRFSTIILTCQVSGNGRDGVEVAGRASGVQVSQSVIGMQTNGLTPQPNGRNGVTIRGRASVVSLGGFEPSVEGVPGFGSFREAANLVSGNRGNGVAILGSTRNVQVLNSFLGTTIDGNAPAPNGLDGILIDGSSRVHVGSSLAAYDPADRVRVGFNAGDGVEVRRGTQNGILGNATFGNFGPGIKLGRGANANAPAPLLVSAAIDPATGLAAVSGSLRAARSRTYLVEFFANVEGGPVGLAFLGRRSVRTGPDGVARFAFTDLAVPAEDRGPFSFVTATATSLAGNTSAFSDSIRAGA